MKPITDWQKSSLKNKLVWLSSTPNYKPTEIFMRWWNEQEPKEMEKKLDKLTFNQAATLNYEITMCNWTNVIELWQRFTD